MLIKRFSKKKTYLFKIRSKQKNKYLTKRHKHNNKGIRNYTPNGTRKRQRGGFNLIIKNYYSNLRNNINTYDIKIMLIYTYTNNQNLPEEDKKLINAYMKLQSFGRITQEITKDILQQIYKEISRILGIQITGVISMDAQGRKEDRNWHIWLDMLRIKNLLDETQIEKIKQIFTDTGILKPNNTLESLFIQTRYSYNNKGNLLNNEGNPIYSDPALLRSDSRTSASADVKLNQLTHFWFKQWPDHGVPADLTNYCNFIIDIYNHIMTFGGGSIIHCSAGVGRTGVVYITLNLLFEFGINPNDKFPLDKADPSITAEVIMIRIMNARQFRMALVQTKEQYNFILKCFGINNYIQTEDDISNIESNSNPFKKPTTKAQLQENKSKNRYTNILPYDDIIANTLKTPKNPNGYINASNAPCIGPTTKPKNWNSPNFILSQCPIPYTIQDFRNMIRLNNIRRIIMVTELVESGRVKCNDYLALEITEPLKIIDNEFTLINTKIMNYGKQQEYNYTPIIYIRTRSNSSSSA